MDTHPARPGWSIQREGRLDPDDHGRIAFPAFADSFPGRRSWSGARPELRVIAHDSHGVAAHAGVLRRFIQLTNDERTVEQLVAIVGLVAVRPDLQGTGVGKQLGARIADALGELTVPFGLLGCHDEVIGYYQSAGWQLLPPTRTVYNPLDIHDPSRVVESSDGWLILPVAEPVTRWPAGEMHWNGASV